MDAMSLIETERSLFFLYEKSSKKIVFSARRKHLELMNKEARQ